MTIRAVAIICLLSVIAGCTEADRSAGPPRSVASFTTVDTARTLSAAPGGVLYIPVKATIDSGWRLYSVTQKNGGPTAMSFTAAPAESFRVEGTPQGPRPEIRPDTIAGMETETYKGQPTLLVPVRVADAAKPGRTDLQLTVRSQACSDKICLSPTIDTVTVPVTIDAR